MLKDFYKINNRFNVINILIIKIISREIKYKNEDTKASFFTLKTTGFNVH